MTSQGGEEGQSPSVISSLPLLLTFLYHLAFITYDYSCRNIFYSAKLYYYFKERDDDDLAWWRACNADAAEIERNVKRINNFEYRVNSYLFIITYLFLHIYFWYFNSSSVPTWMSPSSQIVCEDTRCNGERQTNKPSIEKNFSRTSINKILTVEYECPCLSM